MYLWAIQRGGPGGYTDSSRTDRDGGDPVEFMPFHFPEAQTAREFAATFELIGAKAKPD